MREGTGSGAEEFASLNGRYGSGVPLLGKGDVERREMNVCGS